MPTPRFYRVVSDGVFVPTPVGGVVFRPATAHVPVVATVRAQVRYRRLQGFVRRGRRLVYLGVESRAQARLAPAPIAPTSR